MYAVDNPVALLNQHLSKEIKQYINKRTIRMRSNDINLGLLMCVGPQEDVENTSHTGKYSHG